MTRNGVIAAARRGMPDFFISFGTKSVTVRASHTLLLRWAWKAVFYLVVGTGLLTFTSDGMVGR